MLQPDLELGACLARGGGLLERGSALLGGQGRQRHAGHLGIGSWIGSGRDGHADPGTSGAGAPGATPTPAPGPVGRPVSTPADDLPLVAARAGVSGASRGRSRQQVRPGAARTAIFPCGGPCRRVGATRRRSARDRSAGRHRERGPVGRRPASGSGSEAAAILAAAAPGSAAPVMGRPMTSRSAPSARACCGVATRAWSCDGGAGRAHARGDQHDARADLGADRGDLLRGADQAPARRRRRPARRAGGRRPAAARPGRRLQGRVGHAGQHGDRGDLDVAGSGLDRGPDHVGARRWRARSGSAA